MKKLFIVVLILIVGSPLVSRAENTILLTCVGLIGKENRIVHIVVLKNINSILQMQVKIDSTTIYVKNVTRSTLPDRIVFESESFKNLRNTPSGLFLQVWKSEMGGFTGEFSEISYLPQIEVGSVVVCR
ncbi:hypothetical protein ACO1KB_21530 [Leptospira interrogans serovar Szwajizak]|uniref:hypothetical protein n=1 Tax=Leptospira interrogans TaxID=173 RepID=UPI0004A2B848|nr:hypothetical protein [Leptospira interrogans]